MLEMPVDGSCTALPFEQQDDLGSAYVYECVTLLSRKQEVVFQQQWPSSTKPLLFRQCSLDRHSDQTLPWE